VGGYALAFHGAPRYTGDLDILIKPEEENECPSGDESVGPLRESFASDFMGKHK